MVNLLKPTHSLDSNLMLAREQPKPEVGMGATELMYTDRQAATIIEVRGSTIIVQYDTATRTDKNGQSESQAYEYKPNPDGEKKTVTLRKNGRWVTRGHRAHNGTPWAIGVRKAYHDYGF